MAKAATKSEEAVREVSAYELARVLGKTINLIHTLTRTEILRQSSRGRYDLAASVQTYIKHGQDGLRAKYAVDGASKASLADAKAKLAQLELKKAEGLVVDTSAAISVMTAVIGRSKLRLLAIPARLAPRIGTTRNAIEAQAMIADEIHLALVDLSSGPGLAEDIVAEATGAD